MASAQDILGVVTKSDSLGKYGHLVNFYSADLLLGRLEERATIVCARQFSTTGTGTVQVDLLHIGSALSY